VLQIAMIVNPESIWRLDKGKVATVNANRSTGGIAAVRMRQRSSPLGPLSMNTSKSPDHPRFTESCEHLAAIRDTDT
jgi:hypothetical protein